MQRPGSNNLIGHAKCFGLEGRRLILVPGPVHEDVEWSSIPYECDSLVSQSSQRACGMESIRMLDRLYRTFSLDHSCTSRAKIKIKILNRTRLAGRQRTPEITRSFLVFSTKALVWPWPPGFHGRTWNMETVDAESILRRFPLLEEYRFRFNRSWGITRSTVPARRSIDSGRFGGGCPLDYLCSSTHYPCISIRTLLQWTSAWNVC